MSGIIEVINQLDDSALATIDIPITEGEDQRLNCVLKKTQAPSFRLVFPPHTLPLDRIEFGTPCRVVVKHIDGAINLKVRIDQTDGDRTLLLTAVESINPEALREYFRVMISLPIRASFTVDRPEYRHRSWELEGYTIDLSGGGVLALFPGKPQTKSHIHLDLQLPDQQHIHCLGKVVRTYRMRKKRYQVAFMFENIDQKSRDMIISCCLKEQRRQLREKVRVD